MENKEETSGAKPLTRELASKNLSSLGYNPLNLQHAFLELSVSNLDLCDVDTIAQFPNVMYLNVSMNQLNNLKVLSSLQCLVQLNASHNKLTECFDFAPPHCRPEQSWETGHLAPGSMLTHVNLKNNCISRIFNVASHRFIECLLLSNNQISVITGLSELKFLKTLDISHNLLKEISGLDDLPIRELNLSGNHIRSLSGLSKLSCLTSLIVADNQIESLLPLAGCNSLSLLDVSRNKLLHIRQTEFLREVPWLNVLLLHGNPCYKKEHYRLRVLYRLPHLKRLDMQNASEEEKIRAFNLYQAAGGDLHLREQVHNKYITDEPFADHSTAQFAGGCDDEEGLSYSELSSANNEQVNYAHDAATGYFQGILQTLA